MPAEETHEDALRLAGAVSCCGWAHSLPASKMDGDNHDLGRDAVNLMNSADISALWDALTKLAKLVRPLLSESSEMPDIQAAF